MTDIENAAASYRYKGSEWALTFPADSWEDAEARLHAIRTTASLEGWPCHIYRATSVTLPFVHVWVVASTFIRNLFGARP